MMSGKIPLTVVVPILNESKNIGRCLAALKNFSRVIVVDSGSQDDSCEIAKRHGAEILLFSWNGRYPKKRNWVLSNQTFETDWVLFLDADEVVTPEFESAVTEAIQKAEVNGYWLTYRNCFQDRCLRFGVPQRKLALFRHGSGAYERVDEDRWSTLDMEVHEHPVIEGRVGFISAPIIHYDDRGVHKFIARHNEYSDWEAKRYVDLNRSGESQANLTWRQKVKYSLIESNLYGIAYFIFAYVVRLGFIDGRAGFNYAMLKGFYFHQVAMKISELRRGEAAATDIGCSAG